LRQREEVQKLLSEETKWRHRRMNRQPRSFSADAGDNVLMPGAIPTNLQRYTGGMKTPPERRKTPE
jgi:hypothetical protein